MQDMPKYHKALADGLRIRGLVTDPRWEQVLRDVPRHLFVPTRAWAVPNHESASPRGKVDLTADPAAFLDAIYSDTAIVIQADDGDGDPASGARDFTSSVSAPGVVLPFLELLAPKSGDRILEIGTGSGWTAAMLAWAVGQDCVTSVEVDTAVAAQAAANLRRAGFSPHLVVGDGIEGCPQRAPYDRVHVTVGVSDIPMAWIQQTRPGGFIVMPWQPSGRLGYMLRLRATSEGTAIGSFHGAASYMMLRSQRQNSRWNSHHAEEAEHSTSRLDPRNVAAADLGATLLMAALAPKIDWRVIDEDGVYSLLLFETTDSDGSWAACDMDSGDDFARVTQFGKRRLWEEVSDAYFRWMSLGSPSLDQFGLTVRPDGTYLWLDHQSGPNWPKTPHPSPAADEDPGDHPRIT